MTGNISTIGCVVIILMIIKKATAKPKLIQEHIEFFSKKNYQEGTQAASEYKLILSIFPHHQTMITISMK